MPNARRPPPSSSPEEVRPAIATTKQIGVRVPARMGDQLVALARRENNGVSAVIRRLLTAGLAAHGNNEAA